jgi:hypothetical protein
MFSSGKKSCKATDEARQKHLVSSKKEIDEFIELESKLNTEQASGNKATNHKPGLLRVDATVGSFNSSSNLRFPKPGEAREATEKKSQSPKTIKSSLMSETRQSNFQSASINRRDRQLKEPQGSPKLLKTRQAIFRAPQDLRLVELSEDTAFDIQERSQQTLGESETQFGRLEARIPSHLQRSPLFLKSQSPVYLSKEATSFDASSLC